MRTASLLACLLLASCTRWPSGPDASNPMIGAPAQADCAALFAAQRRLSTASADGQYQRLEGFAGLRSDRLLAALGRSAKTPEQRRLWLQQLAARDAKASAIEWGNLPVTTRARWRDAQPALQFPQQHTQQQLARCRAAQVQHLSRDDKAFKQVVDAAQVADDYRGWARALGLYPLFKPFYQHGIRAWQTQAAHVAAPAESAQWLTYQPLDEAQPMRGVLASDALGLPQPTAPQRAALLAQHAPLLRIEQLSRADRLGSPSFAADGQRSFNEWAPQLYQRLGWSRLDGRWHLQLVYQLWFSQRPKTHELDLYAGELDGLIWRVTLNDRGDAVLYDAIHPCGCWHAFFLPASSPWQFRQPAHQETRLARRLQNTGQRAATLWLSGREHRLLWVDERRSPYPAIDYTCIELDQLRQLPHPQGRRSLYGPDGLVAGSERLERWLLWPSGVRSPGAMRQWGRHATAFVGRAQFDDPQLLDHYVYRP
ncbi:MAG: hypothetical protein ACOH2I_04530 [Pseudomonas sp.]